jgi:hypothetical protein
VRVDDARAGDRRARGREDIDPVPALGHAHREVGHEHLRSACCGSAIAVTSGATIATRSRSGRPAPSDAVAASPRARAVFLGVIAGERRRSGVAWSPMQTRASASGVGAEARSGRRLLLLLGSSRGPCALPVLLELDDALVRERVVDHLLEDLERQRRDVGAGERACVTWSGLRIDAARTSDSISWIANISASSRMTIMPSWLMSSSRPTNGLIRLAPALAASRP